LRLPGDPRKDRRGGAFTEIDVLVFNLSGPVAAKHCFHTATGRPANAALFLTSDEVNFITGVALPVDGGALVEIG
jgi:hypothetical protein